MTSVGTVLKTERERQGREPAEIAEELCITQRYLRAIEQDDLKTLPGIFFYKSFVKQYATLLGVDEGLIKPGIEALTAQSEPLPLPGAENSQQPRRNGSSHLSNPSHFATKEAQPVRDLDPIVRDGNRRYIPDGRIGMSIAALVAVLLACSGFYSWWNRAPQPAAAKAELSVQVTAPPVAQKPAVEASLAPVAAVQAPADLNHVVLNLSATEKTWLSIVSDGKEIFSGVLEPSQTKTLTGIDIARVRIGNAGGVEIQWNGKAIGPVGPRGQVRTVVFTPENFQILSPNTL
jgi:cytoskeletal protein RodZ